MAPENGSDVQYCTLIPDSLEFSSWFFLSPKVSFCYLLNGMLLLEFELENWRVWVLNSQTEYSKQTSETFTLELYTFHCHTKASISKEISLLFSSLKSASLQGSFCNFGTFWVQVCFLFKGFLFPSSVSKSCYMWLWINGFYMELSIKSWITTHKRGYCLHSSICE